MRILDISKHLMYDFYHNKLRAQYGNSVQLLYTGTDSLLLEIQTEDAYRNMVKHQDLYDTSEYSEDQPLHSTANKKVLEKMKDDCAGRPVAEYVGLWPKMYSILEAGGKVIKKAKGVKKKVVKKHIRHEEYREALFEKQTFPHGMNALWSVRHRIYGQYLNKVWFSHFDSNCWIAENGVHTLAYEHTYAIPASCRADTEMDAD
ncbi:MAG: hypothetical protein AB2610_20920 [Candidatus Thiodiazotropha sp.]